MRFTNVQVALFKCGISFVHMAPTEARRSAAIQDFKRALGGWYTGTATDSVVYSGSGDVFARFMLCVMRGASTNHCPVMFMDGKKDEFPEPKAYDEARWIPATDSNGCGPMVIR